ACWSPSITSCADCLQRGPQCAWCFQEDYLHGAEQSRRCDLPDNLRRRGCRPEFMERSDVKVEVDATLNSTQVSPREISITLRPEASFVVAVKQLERYPVDLYYLVDVSASMQENLDHVGLADLGVALSLRMTQHTSDLWLGFGSFVDKPVSPFMSVHPSKIDNPCSDYHIRCRPAHGFHHVLSMTGNISEFTRVMKRQRISANVDTPEGGLDAMLQAAVCQRAVGWRPEAKRLLLLMTDQPSHLALDSKLAGIVTPHDGRCHLDNNVYTGSTKMDHPSLGLLSDKLLENHIYPIFAVEKMQYQWYELGLFQAPNLIDLVVDAYKVKSSTCGFSLKIPFFFHSSKEDASAIEKSKSFTLEKMLVHPVGYNESTVISIRSKCQCKCGPTGHCDGNDQSPCRGSHHGVSQEQRPDHGHMKDSSSDPNRNCKADGSNVNCSGRGVCECGKCVCEQSRLGTVYGKYCEMDDFSCPYEKGQLCGGRGVCVSGDCVCEVGWTGDSCSCPTSKTSCQSADGLLCSGCGECVCGKCVCTDPQRSGDFCERCPTCQVIRKSSWYLVNYYLNPKYLNLLGNDSCQCRFQINSHSGQAQLHISKRPEQCKHTHTCFPARSLPLLPRLLQYTLVDWSQQAGCQCYSCILHFLSVSSSLC
uniref:Integrin beta n=1 Tax=Xiphophorus couchianus TaxID=32473 RepID=A0A3B5MRK1_9TELE